ncbi:MAG: UDP-2,3-diacylglucosamine diphosphatase LpxI [Candidatus Omnitrophota bacterium]
MEQPQILGLIAGNGKFPLLFVHEAKKRKIKVIAVGIKGDTSFFLRFFVDQFLLVSAGELKKLFDFLKDQNVKQVIMAGQVNPENLFDETVALDHEFQKLFSALKDRKADTIFSAVAAKLKENGMELLDSTFLLAEYLAPKGTLTKRAPTLQELEDISFGKDIAKNMGLLDVGQTVAVKDKAIVAIEAMEGTDQTILRAGRISRRGAVIVKMAKPQQDNRFDIPVIGPRTIESMIKVKAGCLAIEAGKTLIIDREKTVRLANAHQICLVSG